MLFQQDKCESKYSMITIHNPKLKIFEHAYMSNQLKKIKEKC